MKKKRIVSLSLIVALIAIIAGGTYAYFTDTSNDAKNTFTVGNVELSLTESKLKEDGTVEEDGLDKEIDGNFEGNEYKLIPGKTYTKDPKFHLGATSEPAWVFAEVKLGLNNVEKDDEYTIEQQMKELGWVEVIRKTDNGIPTVLMRHKDVQEAGSTPLLFGRFHIDSDLDSKSEEGKYVLTNNGDTVFHSDITIKGFAIQSEGINDVTEVDEIAKGHFNFK